MTAKKRKKKSTPKKRKTTAKRKTKRSISSALKFLSSTHAAVRTHLKAATDLPTFLNTAGDLTLAARRRIVDQAMVLIQDNFVHLTLKKTMHGVDPVQKLTLIKHRLDQATTSSMGSEFAFHREMIDVFTSVRDLHTNYILPAPFGDKVTFLPFDVEEYFDGGTSHFIATHFMEGFSHPHFKQGVEIQSWNGIPIHRAIELSADKHDMRAE